MKTHRQAFYGIPGRNGGCQSSPEVMSNRDRPPFWRKCSRNLLGFFMILPFIRKNGGIISIPLFSLFNTHNQIRPQATWNCHHQCGLMMQIRVVAGRGYVVVGYPRCVFPLTHSQIKLAVEDIFVVVRSKARLPSQFHILNFNFHTI